MTPLPVKPTVVVLINKNAPNLIEAVASNIARTDDPNDPLTVKVVTTAIDFANEALGKPFDSTRPVTV